MKASYYLNESVNHDSATDKAFRYGKTFLMKPAVEAKSFMCTDLNFRETQECPRVIRMEDYINGLEHMSDEEAFRLAGNQPVFYFQERFATNDEDLMVGYEWNGFLLYRTTCKAEARQAVREHADDLNIILAYDNPMDNLYYILIDTKTEKFDEKTLRHKRFKHKSLLMKYIPTVIWLDIAYFARAFSENHYDLIDRDALFGKPIVVSDGFKTVSKGSNETLETTDSKRQPETIGSILKQFFSHLFRRTA